MSKANPNVYVNNIFDEGKTVDDVEYEDCSGTGDQSDYEEVNPIPKRSPKKTVVNTAHNITNNQSVQDNSRSQKKKVPWRWPLFISCFLVIIVVSNVVTFITTKDKFSEKKTQHLLCSSFTCLNGGSCINDDGQFNCSCTQGFSGKQCEVTPCTRLKCLNGGSCEVLNGTFHCLCSSDFSGQLCEEPAPCSSNPCFHYASCVKSGNNYTCDCPVGTGGNRCQDDYYTVITSPGYPSSYYTDNVNKTWRIYGSGKNLKIKFTHFDLESGFDFVKVYNGEPTKCCSLGNYTGNTLPTEFTFTGRYMSMVFTSDGSQRRAGFRAVVYKKNTF